MKKEKVKKLERVLRDVLYEAVKDLFFENKEEYEEVNPPTVINYYISEDSDYLRGGSKDFWSIEFVLRKKPKNKKSLNSDLNSNKESSNSEDVKESEKVVIKRVLCLI